MTITLTTLGSCAVRLAAKPAALVEADGGVEPHFDARRHERPIICTLTISRARQLSRTSARSSTSELRPGRPGPRAGPDRLRHLRTERVL